MHISTYLKITLLTKIEALRSLEIKLFTYSASLDDVVSEWASSESVISPDILKNNDALGVNDWPLTGKSQMYHQTNCCPNEFFWGVGWTWEDIDLVLLYHRYWAGPIEWFQCKTKILRHTERHLNCGVLRTMYHTARVVTVGFKFKNDTFS